jgi:hypothetical protein
MRTYGPIASTLAVAAALAAPAIARAEGEPTPERAPSADLRGLYAPMHPDSGHTMERTASPDTWDLTAVARLSYALRPVALRDPMGTLAYSVVSRQSIADLGLSMGILRRVTVGVDLPVLLSRRRRSAIPRSA